MLTTSEMIFRFLIAIILGTVIGMERESIGKEAGVRTDIMVSAGAAIFTMIALLLPYEISVSNGHLLEITARNSGFLSVIANIVVGIGFLGAGIIIHQGIHVRGLTTAASVWFVAAVGILAGLGQITFAAISVLIMTLLMIILRRIDFRTVLGKEAGPENKES